MQLLANILIYYPAPLKLRFLFVDFTKPLYKNTKIKDKTLAES